MSKPVDTDRWPVVVVVIDGSLDLEAAESVTAELGGLLDRNERLGLVFDYQHGIPEVQQFVSMWMAEQVAVLERLVAGAVTVVPADRVEHMQSMIADGGFAMPFPSWATATVDEGVVWVRSQL